MAHFAKVINGVVHQVIVAEPEVIQAGTLGDPDRWVQTSYNTYRGKHPNDTPLRYNFAGVGYIYDVDADAFYPPQPFESWTLNTDGYYWEPPVPHPNDDKIYKWDEEKKTWTEVVM